MYPHHVFNLEPAGTFRMYPICYRWVSGGYLQPEPAMYSRCFHWFPGPLAPSDSTWTNTSVHVLCKVVEMIKLPILPTAPRLSWCACWLATCGVSSRSHIFTPLIHASGIWPSWPVLPFCLCEHRFKHFLPKLRPPYCLSHVAHLYPTKWYPI